MLRRSLFALAVVASTVVACSSLPELSFDEDGGTAGEGGMGEAGLDGGRDTAPPCVKTGPELCDDGLDNDCNGLADCADPQCGTFSCVTPAPDGWELVAFAETAPPACPTGYTAPTDLKVVPGTIAHSCPCSCAGAGGSGATCAGATTAVVTGDDPACPSAATNLKSDTGGTCTATPVALQMGGGASTGFGKITSPIGPATCTPVASITKTDPSNGRSCTAPAKSGAGCTGTMRCLPKATGFTMCIEKLGDQVCPTGFAKRNLAGTTADDTRVCLPCTCAKDPCVGDVILWSNAQCNAKQSVLTTAGNTLCAAPQAGSQANVSAGFYKSTITGGCKIATPSTAQGTLTFGGQRTICCK